jgi:hypothetical protein
MLFFRLLLAASQSFFRSRSQLALENLALRHQLAVLRRFVPRPRIEDRDRRLWMLLRRFLDGWRDALILFQPDTVVRWLTLLHLHTACKPKGLTAASNIQAYRRKIGSVPSGTLKNKQFIAVA